MEPTTLEPQEDETSDLEFDSINEPNTPVTDDDESGLVGLSVDSQEDLIVVNDVDQPSEEKDDNNP